MIAPNSNDVGTILLEPIISIASGHAGGVKNGDHWNMGGVGILFSDNSFNFIEYQYYNQVKTGIELVIAITILKIR